MYTLKFILDTQLFKAKVEIPVKTWILFHVYKCLYTVYKFHIAIFMYKIHKICTSKQICQNLQTLSDGLQKVFVNAANCIFFQKILIKGHLDLILNNILGGWRLIQYKTVILTLNMPSCLTDYQRFIHILYNILDFVQQRTQLKMEQLCMLLILYCQYHVCWYPGDLMSQGIGRHGIDQISQNISSVASEELTMNSVNYQNVVEI